MGMQPKKLLQIGMDGMNLPLLRKFAAEGVLPAFSALMARGSTNRLLPAIPAWTPTNWATMATGAPAGTHQLGGWSVRRKTDPWEAPRADSWSSDAMAAEAIWDVFDSAGRRSVVSFYPSGSWPGRLRHGTVIAAGLHDSPCELARPAQYLLSTQAPAGASGSATTAGPELRERPTGLAEEGLPPGSARIGLVPAREAGWTNGGEGALAAAIPVALVRGGTEWLHALVDRRPDSSFARLRLYAQPGDEAPLADLPGGRPRELGEWSPFARRIWGEPGAPGAAEGTVRFRVMDSRPGEGALRFCRSQVFRADGFTVPAGLSPRLLEACGPFFDMFTVGARDDTGLRIFLDDIRYQGEWLSKAARYLAEHGGWDLHWCHWHLFDHINHPTVNGADPDGPDYDPQRGEWLMNAQRQTYVVGDAVLKQFLELADDETLVCVVSDHALSPTHRCGDVLGRLAECGLVVFKDEARREIDFALSHVYMQNDRGAEIFVNLQGREPMGIVPAGDYERVQAQVVDALLDWRDSENGRRVVALALPLQDGQLIGYWGDVCGDVVFVMSRGYGWGTPLGGGTAGRGRGAFHSSQIPTAETRHFTNMACWILAGPGVKAGYERDWQRHGLMRQTDVAPTLCHLLGLRPPAQSIGAVCHDLFAD
ncbi:MAG: alkaline phosphatase family protein [Chloroflexi bacterium]|nr:alkaline phosphatase family protein [Chloroflexota bacterium]